MGTLHNVAASLVVWGKMRVIIDTNIICADYRLRTPAFHTLLNMGLEIEHKLFVPRIVLDEDVHRYSEDIRVWKDDLDKLWKRGKRWLSDSPNNPDNPVTDELVEEEITSYRNMLEAMFAKAGVGVLPYPNTPHAEVVRRIGAKRKPFRVETKEQGYKDYLIWQNVLEVAQSPGDRVAFVSNNKRDFADEGGLLHPHLVEDIDGLGMGPDRVTYFTDLLLCVKDIIEPDVDLAKNFRFALESDEPEDDTLRAAVVDKLTKELLNNEIPASSVDLPNGTDNVTIVAIEGKPQFSIDSVRRLSDEESLVSITIQVECSLDFFMEKFEVFEASETDDKRIQVNDFDWNEWYAWAGMTTIVHGTLDITWSRRDAAITSADFEAYNPRY